MQNIAGLPYVRNDTKTRYSIHPKSYSHLLLKYLHAQGPAWGVFFFSHDLSTKMPMEFCGKDSEGLQAVPDDTILPQAVKIGDGVEVGFPHPKIDVYPEHYYQLAASAQGKKTIFGLRKTTLLLSFFNLLMMVALVVLWASFASRKTL